MTAGRYLIMARTSATSTEADATQTVVIKLGGAPCAASGRSPFTEKKGLRMGCIVSLLTDRPIVAHGGVRDPRRDAEPRWAKAGVPAASLDGVVQAAAVAFRGPPAAAEAPKE